MAVCTHLDQIKLTDPAGPIEGCQECLKTGGRWVHLRMCETCGRIGCCDARHVSAAHLGGRPSGGRMGGMAGPPWWRGPDHSAGTASTAAATA